ncbi:MAG: nucleotidyltransferase domain-containing protein [Candidatus Bathyarchaeia archaeon]
MLKEEELRKLVAKLASEAPSMEGLTSIILYGSYARGNHHRKSDVDLLLIFRDEESLMKAEDKIQTIYCLSDATLSIETITLNRMEEYAKSNPYLFRNILKEGLIVFASPPFKIKLKEALNGWLKVLITYEMTQLPNRTKKKIDRILYGVKHKGKWICKGITSEEERIGRGTLLLTPEKAEKVKETLEKQGAKYKEKTIIQIEP